MKNQYCQNLFHQIMLIAKKVYGPKKSRQSTTFNFALSEGCKEIIVWISCGKYGMSV